MYIQLLLRYLYGIMAVWKVQIDIITSITVSQTGPAVIMYVETFKSALIVFIVNIIMYLTSYWQIIFSIRSNSLILTILLAVIKEEMSKLHIKNDLSKSWWKAQLNNKTNFYQNKKKLCSSTYEILYIMKPLSGLSVQLKKKKECYVLNEYINC